MSWENILKKPFDATARRERQHKNKISGSKIQAIKTYLDPYMNIALTGQKAKYTENQKLLRDRYMRDKKGLAPSSSFEQGKEQGGTTRQGNRRGMKYPSKSPSGDFELRIPTDDMEKFPQKVRSIIFKLKDEELEKLYNITIVGRQETKYNRTGFEFQFILNN